MKALKSPYPYAALAIASSLFSGGAMAQDGGPIFQRRCASCHSMEEGVNRAGPSLANLFGRTAGTLDGARYSAGMRNSNVVWDESTLDSFLAAPRDIVAGTSMTMALRDEDERRAIVEFLQSAP